MKLKLSIFLFAAVTIAARAVTISQWTFETSQPATAGGFAPELGSGSASGNHAGAAVFSSPAGNGSAHSFSSTLWAVGDNYQFKGINTVGYIDIQVSFDQTSSGTGPKDFTLQYYDGSGFIDFEDYVVMANGASPNAAWNTTTFISAYHYSFDLSAVAFIENNTSVIFRLRDKTTASAGGGTVGTAGTDRVDNFTVSGASVPESLPFCFSAFAILGVLGFARKFRVRSAAT